MRVDPQDLRALLVREFPAARRVRPDDDTDLLESGVLDSLAVLDLVGHLEAAFSITIDDDDLVPDNFRTVARLTAFVRDKRSATELPAR